MSRRQFLSAALLASSFCVLAPSNGGPNILEPTPRRAAPVRIAPPDVVPPLLVVSEGAGSSIFGDYLAHILLAEGLTFFRRVAAADLTPDVLAAAQVVLFAERSLPRAVVGDLERFVAQGGRVIAMRPDPTLAPLFGVVALGTSAASGVLDVTSLGNDPHPPTGLQFHGVADHYRVVGAQTLAWIRHASPGSDRSPAITLRQFGKGWVSLWAFDLATSVVLTRQGNAARAGQEHDGVHGVRAVDAFIDWIDLNRIGVPQADEQMRLLTGLIRTMLADIAPIPRVWYFPNAAPGLLIATSDAHASSTGAIETILREAELYDGAASIYYATPQRTGSTVRQSLARTRNRISDTMNPFPTTVHHLPTSAEVARWRQRGHEFGMHPYVEQGAREGYYADRVSFILEGYGAPSSTVRTHRVLWDGWVETARLQAQLGFGLNLDYYHYGPIFRTTTGAWAHGFFTGSGLPMKMVDDQGRIIETYQLLTSLVDEHLFGAWNLNLPHLDVEAALTVSQKILDDAATHGMAIAAQFHADFMDTRSAMRAKVLPWMQGTFAHAASKGIAICSAERYLNFTQEREAVSLQRIAYSSEQRSLRFDVIASVFDALLPAVEIPLQHGATRLRRVMLDGRAVDWVEHPGVQRASALVCLGDGEQQVEAWYA